jgi:GT2 family glycosyltransferase|tara:strand:- start:3980 stop:4828 length:849 start_codon:yes stop_codon:yes gene_type:complete
MNDQITVVLISHNSKDLVINIIKKIYNKFNIIIIDNSNDLILEKQIKENYSKITIELINNNGYGAAINYACKLVKTKYFLVSNPDIYGLNEKNINEFTNAAKILNDNFSVLGPRFINADPKSHVQSDNKKNVEEMKFISGSCMFFKKEIFNFFGGFDENYFLYFEESDFCLRSHKIKKNYQINNIIITHNVGTSVSTKGTDERKNLEKLYTWHFIWSKFYYYKKHYTYPLAIVIFVPIMIRILFRIILSIYNKDIKKKEKYVERWSGLLNSIKGSKSFKRMK